MFCNNTLALELYDGECATNSYWIRGLECDFNHETDKWEYQCICKRAHFRYGENDNCIKWTSAMIISCLPTFVMLISNIWIVRYI